MFFFTTYYFINETKRIIYLSITCNFLYKRIENKSRIKFLRELLLENYSKLFIDKLNILISFLINLMLYQLKQIKILGFLITTHYWCNRADNLTRSRFKAIQSRNIHEY